MITAMAQSSLLPLDTHMDFRSLVEAGATEDMARTIVDMHVDTHNRTRHQG